MKNFVVIAVIFFSLMLPYNSFAHNTFVLDGKEYTKDELIADFTGIAFSDKSWPEPDMADNFLGAQGGPYEEKDFAKGYPWLSEYMFRGKGYPNTELLSKWSRKKITISFGWPRYSHQCAIQLGKATIIDGKEYRCGFSSEYCEFEVGLSNGSYPEIISHIESLIPQIESASGLDIDIRMPDDPVEKTEDFARIRIVPVSMNRQKNFFKMYRWGMGAEGYTWSLASNEAYIFGAMSFTTDTRSQVDGYLIPEGDNSLGLAICKIMPAVGIPMMKALLGECLVRSLGLLDLSSNASALLGNWNKIYDGNSKLKDIDGQSEAVLPVGKAWGKDQKFVQLNNLEQFMTSSEYDRMMLRLLYCDALHPGMGRKETEEVLRKNGYCFK